MEQYVDQVRFQIAELVGGYIPTLVAALLLLIIGWLVALAVSRSVERILSHSGLAERLAKWTAIEAPSVAMKPGRGVRRVVFWVLMLFVLVGFFQVLGIPRVIEPINQLLGQVFLYVPRLFGAGLLLLIAWGLATLLRLVVRKALIAVKLDQKIVAETDTNEPPAVSMSQSISATVYWLVFLLFLPAVLDALKLQGLLQPVQGMLDEILAVLPNVLAAGVILLVGWFIARILQRIITNLLSSAGIDRISARLNLTGTLKERGLSGLIGMVVYFLVLIPVLVAAFNVLGLDALTRPTTNMLDSILAALPQVFAAVLILTIAYVVGRLVVGLITNLLTSVGFNQVLVRLGIGREPTQGMRTPSETVGHLALIAIMFLAAIEASHLLGFSWLVGLGTQFTVFAGQILLGVVVFGIGLFLANLVTKAILDGSPTHSKLLAVAARTAILVLASAMALRQMGLANEIVNLAFGLLLGSIAVAVALAFGLGGREEAGRQLKGWIESLRTDRQDK